MKYSINSNICIYILLALWMVARGMAFPVSCSGSVTKSYQIILFVSKNIRPYVEAVDGFRERIETSMVADVEVIMLDRFSDKSRVDLADRVARQSETDIVAAIGPEAAAFVWDAFAELDAAKIYSLILNPEKVAGDLASTTGIPLNIPPADQLRLISLGLSDVTRVGIFYDPKYNVDFYKEALAATLELEVDLVPLAVNSRKDIPFLLSECWDSIDCVWLIPDRTVISESIAQYIIKQAVLKKVPVVGYNRFFYDSGAAMAFVFDYAELGRQTADLAVSVLRQENETDIRSPVFSVWLNEMVYKKMGIEMPQPVRSPMMVGP